MNDKERMDIIDRCYTDMLQYRSLVQYYTNKNIGVSYPVSYTHLRVRVWRYRRQRKEEAERRARRKARRRKPETDKSKGKTETAVPSDVYKRQVQRDMQYRLHRVPVGGEVALESP